MCLPNRPGRTQHAGDGTGGDARGTPPPTPGSTPPAPSGACGGEVGFGALQLVLEDGQFLNRFRESASIRSHVCAPLIICELEDLSQLLSSLNRSNRISAFFFAVMYD